jgi:hypothetical protein
LATNFKSLSESVNIDWLHTSFLTVLMQCTGRLSFPERNPVFRALPGSAVHPSNVQSWSFEYQAFRSQILLAGNKEVISHIGLALGEVASYAFLTYQSETASGVQRIAFAQAGRGIIGAAI